jgi:FkbM family methyltransferase
MIKKYLRLGKIVFFVLVSNPKVFFKTVFLILKSFLFGVNKYPPVKNINGIIFDLDFKDLGQMKKKIYYNIYEIGVVEALKTFLREGDTFIDVGANVGYITSVGASLVGKKGKVYAFEPVLEYFCRIKNIAKLNNEYNIIVNQFALSDKAETRKIYLYDYSNIGANTVIPELIKKEKIRETSSIQTLRLDEYIEKENIKNIKVIKIDTEGFEYPVLLGLRNFFKKISANKSVPAPLIICEVCPEALKILGYKPDDLFEYMKQFNYFPFSILNFNNELSLKKIKKESTINIIFKTKKL